MTFPAGRILAKTYLLGISPDGGKSWTFLDGTGLQSKEVREKVLPTMPAKLKLPELSPPQIIKE